MDYRKIYIKIISKAKSENRIKGIGAYYEAHHILPKSLFPLWGKRKSNIVLLTAREHFFCHQLLLEIYKCKEMYWALICFKNNNKYMTSKKYDSLKNDFINSLKIKWTPEKRKEESVKQREIWLNSEEYYKSQERKKYKLRQKVIYSIINKCRKIIKDNECKIMAEKVKIQKRKEYRESEEYQINKKKKRITNQFCRKIICLETNKIYNSITDAALELNVKHSALSRVLCGVKHSIHGFHFKYYDS